tara:strand:+ start:2918 stop:4219 length:1302 start_codon:yes stop_codon:yes gene_type:complete
MKSLNFRIKNNREIVGIIGLGYVGLPLAIEFALNHVKVIGFDLNEDKINSLKSGKNYIKDINDSDFESALDGEISFSSNMKLLKDCDVIIICVPTPLDKFKKPDMSFIESACQTIATNMKRNVLISLESTTYPTTTEEFILPIIQKKSKLIHNKDFYLAYSPERVDPGNKKFNTKNTPKVLGALSVEGLKIAKLIYSKAINKIHTVSSPRVAEMVKILENTYRLVNISLINELALLCGKMDIDIHEVIDAASTKPFGFHPFYPSPGIGGHCIPLDPFYLNYIAKKYDFDLTMIDTAGHINMRMPYYMLNKISGLLNNNNKSIKNSKILFLGVSYKKDIADSRESPALKMIELCISKGANIIYHDPYVDKIKLSNNIILKSSNFNDKIFKESDCVVISTDHSVFDRESIKNKSSLIVDLRNFIKSKRSSRIEKI